MTANEEEEDPPAPELLDPVELAPAAALVELAPLPVLVLLLELLVEAREDPVAETVSPTLPVRVTTVPVSGARSFVFASDSWAARTASSSL